MKLLGGERDADEKRHGLTALHVLHTTILLMFYISLLQDMWDRKATMYGSDQLPLQLNVSLSLLDWQRLDDGL